MGAIHRHTGNLPIPQSVCAIFVKMETDPVTPFRLEVASLGNNTEDKVLRSQAVLVGCTDITGQPYPNCATVPFNSIGRPVVLLEPLSLQPY